MNERSETPEAPPQYYSRSDLPQREVFLHRFSLRRKTTLIGLSLAAAIFFTLAGAVTANSVFNRLEAGLETETQASHGMMPEAVRDGRVRSALFAAGSTLSLAAVLLIIARAGPRIIALEFWIRRMGAGDLAHVVRPTGNDEITELAYDLEVLRRQSMRAQQLDLIQELSGELQAKNEQLEETLAELHRTQDQVISRQKLAEMGELTAGVAHEIRNPLQFVLNFAASSQDLMRELQENLEETADRDPELTREILTDLSQNMDRIQEHGKRANRIISDMLAMGRNARGRYSNVDVNVLVDDHLMLAYHSVRGQNPEFNAQIIKEFSPDAGEATVVPEDIGRVVLNLVSNACHALAQRTQAEPEHEPVLRVGTGRLGEGVEITVRDNGTGMPKDVAEKVFNPFFTTKAAGQGTGLGLSLSNDIVREHGGVIQCDSREGEYAEFSVLIPAEPAAQPEKTARETS